LGSLLPLLVVVGLAACQQATPWVAPPVEDPPETCDGDGAGCVGRCCETGYSCQRGQCVDGSADRDLDGRPAYEDCDDYDDAVFPGAPERCDGVDNNCNGDVDEGVLDDDGLCAECRDLDGDGHRDCDGDCDDDDPAVSPVAPETCDGRDEDCDGEVDEDFDADGDGSATCGAGADCDDADPLVSPGAIEVCDSIDNDCSGEADDGQLCGTTGQCLDGVCTWLLDPAGAEAWHRCGSAASTGSWCSTAACESGTVLVAAPEGGVTELPIGNYEALFRTKVDRFPSESECGRALVLRLRVVDLDDTDDAGCADCYERCGDCADDCAACTVGGATNVLANTRWFTAPDTFAMLAVPFVIDAPRAGHRIEAVAIREGCMGPQVCIRRIRIEAR
jgi:hypothetical protein